MQVNVQAFHESTQINAQTFSLRLDSVFLPGEKKGHGATHFGCF